VNKRDAWYIEDRLLAPATEVLSAVTRLKEVGEPEAAARVMAAVADLTDVCREVRQELFYSQGGFRA
jgi:hypothetical protein